MAQTGEIKFVITAGIPSIDQTGEVKFIITAGIPNAYTSGGGGGRPLPQRIFSGPFSGPFKGAL